jgi:predicted nucleotidyltransferase
MAQRRSKKNIPCQISPFVWGYICNLKNQGVPIKNAYIFGSWTKGTQHKWSDIDIAIISPIFTTWEKRANALYGAKSSDDFNNIEAHGFHPKDFNPRVSPIVHEIIKHGIKII